MDSGARAVPFVECRFTRSSRYGRRLIRCLAVVSALLPAIAFAAQVKVLLRYDDYSSFQTDHRVVAFEQALFEGVRSVGGNLIVGVIPFPGVPHPETAAQAGQVPFPLGEGKRRLLRRYVDADTVTVTVALHGYNHGNNRLNPGTVSEFAGLPEARQALLLGAGREALQQAMGLDVRVFVPPFNHYDQVTLHALAATGFDFLSAGRRGPTTDRVPLGYLPSTVHPQGMPSSVTAALAGGAA